MTFRLGARGSALSLAQAGLVVRALAGRAEIEIVTVRTTGDLLSAAGSPIEWKGDFTRELDEALLEGRIDFAVHSLKDVPSAIPGGILLAAVPEREDPRDVLVAQPPRRLEELPPGSRIGTSSPRRRAQLLAARPDLEVLEARGNVDTRLRRLREGHWDAIVLARAGLARLGRLDEAHETFPEEIMLPAVGQGALALFARAGDRKSVELLETLDHGPSRREAAAERAFLKTIQAGCHAPVAGRARNGPALSLTAAVFAQDGSRSLRERASGAPDRPDELGRSVGDALLARGAAGLLGAGA